MPAFGGVGTVQVTKAGLWNPTVTDSWITITSASGSDQGTLAYSVVPNPQSNIRVGAITETGVDFAITQEAGPPGCTAIQGLPLWLACSIGNSDPNNSASYASGTLTATARGNGIGGTSDSFYFVYQAVPLTGDGTIYARLVNFSNISHAALMLRAGFQPGDTDVFLDFASGLYTFLQLKSRASVGGNTITSFLAGQSPTSPGQSLSYKEIINRATDSKQWNWKIELNREYGAHSLFVLDGTAQRSDYLGNFAFGYLMNAWGSSTFAAKWGGAAFNLYDSFRTGANAFKGSALTGYDDPRDFDAINAGGALYDQQH